SRSSIYDMMGKQAFPKQVKLGGRSVAWVEAEVRAWLDAKISERDGGQ
ncbi:MAG: AlpA family phage regulatory protein, partial [Desulfovibrio desulfuricans]|nr:AlpA family phage regulatory protein [Desulfovibrio desulfuricans]